MPDAFDHCEELVREADKDRFLATLFAPQKYRRALYALYAFNLEVGARARAGARADAGRDPAAMVARRAARRGAAARRRRIRSRPRCATSWCATACRRRRWPI